MMRAISLWQPYASFIAVGKKQNETRGRLTHIRGQVCIHAAKKEAPLWRLPVPLVRLMDLTFNGHELPRGEIVAVADIYDCVPVERFTTLTIGAGDFIILKPEEEMLGDYTLGIGRFAWRLRSVRALPKPVPVIGHQGFFFLSPDVEAKVRAQI